MNNLISKDEFVSVLTDTLNSGKDFIFTPTGDSMLPMLNGVSDTVTLTKKPDKLKRHDIAFYHRRHDDALVLHRVIKVNCDNTFVMSGDNQYYFDTDIPYCDVLAVMKSYSKGGRTVTSSDFRFRVYSFFILIKKYTRLFISKIYHKIFK